MATSKRFLSLDILRGLTVMMMILVNHPGSWSHVYAPLRHSAWDGATPTDMVFPFFIFCTGMSMAFALSRFNGRRIVGLFLVGLGLNLCSCAFKLSELRIFGVLQRIALCYCLASVLILWLKKPWKIALSAIVLGAVYTAVLLIWGDAGAQLTLEGNISRRIDIALVGEAHVYHGYGIPFDPEGLLGTLTGTVTALIGYLVGRMVRSGSGLQLACRIFGIGAGCILASVILNLWIPVNKPLWSISYVMLSGGCAMVLLSVLMIIIDVLGKEKPFTPARWFGCNPLILYVIAELISICNEHFAIWWSSDQFCTTNFLSLCYAVAVVLLLVPLAAVLYKKKIFIKL